MLSTAFGILLWAVATSAASAPTTSNTNAATFAKGSYDFIIVGGGTAGLTIAARLTENPKIRVAVIEAGQYIPDDANINVPQGTGYLNNPKYDWQFSTIPQRGANGKSVYLARGKMVGGSSGINAMIWQRGAGAVYDGWHTAIGNDQTWSFNGLLPYFRKTENWSPPTAVLFPNETVPSSLESAHGENGPVQVSYNNFVTDVDIPCVVGAENLGIPATSNPDGGNSTGIPNLARNVDPTKGVRSYAAPAYYTPNKNRANLFLLTGAQVTKINFNKLGGQIVATGVEILVGQQTYSIKASKEVILSAGSLKTPQLLELSGVGNSTLLKSLGISPLLDLAGVGENLQDHPLCVTDFNVQPGYITLDQLRFNSTYLAEQTKQYQTNHTGALTYTPYIYGVVPLQSVVNASRFQSLISTLDAQIASTNLTPLQKAQYKYQRSLFVEGTVGTVGFTVVPVGNIASQAAPNSSYVSLVAIVMQPFSRGSVHINSTNATAEPVIDMGFLSFDFDADVLTEGLKFNRRWSETEPFSNFIASPNTPNASVVSDDDVRNFGRSNMLAHNHALGSTVMAPKEIGGVVDSRLKVYGLKNVRVADAGIIPMMVDSTITPTVFAIAEKAADMIKQDWHL